MTLSKAPRLLDAFCGAGGCTKGYQRAGFHVVGVDVRPQARYCGDGFIQGDALEFIASHGHEFDAIHASPPCQAHSALRNMWNAQKHPDLIPQTRTLLQTVGLPFVIENVPGAPLENAPLWGAWRLMLCGTMFDLQTPCGSGLIDRVYGHKLRT